MQCSVATQYFGKLCGTQGHAGLHRLFAFRNSQGCAGQRRLFVFCTPELHDPRRLFVFCTRGSPSKVLWCQVSGANISGAKGAGVKAIWRKSSWVEEVCGCAQIRA